MTQADSTNKPTASAAELTKDNVFNLLSNERRRNVLYALYEEPELEKSRLVDSATAREYGEYSDEDRQRVQVTLHQAHLPKLQDHGVIENHNGVYQLGPNADVLLDHLVSESRLHRTLRGLF